MTKNNSKTQEIKFKNTKTELLRKRPGEKWVPIGRRIVVRAFAYDPASDSWYTQIHLRDLDNKPKRLLLSRDDVGRPQTLKAEILKAGYILPSSQDESFLLMKVLANTVPKRRITITNRLGWHEEQYVFPDKVIGAGKQEIVYRNPIDNSPNDKGTHGDINAWKETIGSLALHSSRMRLGICLSLAGPILELIGTESFGINFTGDSSQGKSTIGKVIQTTYRSANERGLFNWDSTSASLDEAAAVHSDQVLVIDELARADQDDAKKVRKVRDTAYRLASGQGRSRSVLYKNKGNLTSWRLVFASSSETPLAALAAKQGDLRPKGEELRLIDLPAVVHPVFGVFESIPEGSTSERLIHETHAACAAVYGVVGRAYVEKLAADRDSAKKKAKSHLIEFQNELNAPMKGWERRFAQQFGTIYAAGMLGVEFGILPWKQKDIMQACKDCYASAREIIPDYDELVDAAITKLRKKLTADKLWIGQADTPNTKQLRTAAGFIRNHPKQGRYFAVKPDRFEKWLATIISPKLVSTYLRKQGHLITARTDVDTKPVKIAKSDSAQKRRYYCIKASFLKG